MTTEHDPAVLRDRTPPRWRRCCSPSASTEATLFRQSRVPAHAQLAYLLECIATTGELNRMIQFKEKGRGVDSTRVSLFTYPVLMAADILLYRPEQVPVGDDQRQHVELTRDLALRFNRRYGAGVHRPRGGHRPRRRARVMDLLHPTRKMAKSADAAGLGATCSTRPTSYAARSAARSPTPTPGRTPSAARRDKPGVTNLLDILEACGGSAARPHDVRRAQEGGHRRGVAMLEPIQARYAELAADPAHVAERYAAGEARCREVTAPVLAAAEAAIGL